uniref:Uncharacterized protein n=1 Tax=Anguilla anguilla TaxID=7936 RepID=A0A0E9RA76_ANGAN
MILLIDVLREVRQRSDYVTRRQHKAKKPVKYLFCISFSASPHSLLN